MDPQDDGVYEFGPFRVDVLDRLLSRDGAPVPLEPTQFQVLSVLVREAGHLVPRKQLIDAVWKETYVDEGALNVNISNLRKKLGDTASQPRYIETVRKSGYRFVAPVTRHLRSAGGVTIADSSLSQPLHPVTSIAHEHRRPRGLAFAAITMLVTFVAGWYWAGSPLNREVTPAIVPLYPFGGIQDDPSFSPDGAQIAFTWRPADSDNYDIYVLRIGELAATRLTSHPGRELSPAWSPDGRHIAFIRQSGSQGEVLLISPAGGPVHKVTETSGSWVAWSPDSRTLALADRAAGETVFSIFLMTTTGASRRQVTFPAVEHTYGDSLPAISPDGREVAFVRRSTFDVADVFVQSPGGREARRLTFDNRQIRGLAWTSNGKELIFSSNRDGRHRLWRVNTDGTGQPAVVERLSEARTVAVSGSRLVYQTFTEDYNIRILHRDAGGTWNASKPSRFAASTRDEQSPQLSPDGRRLAFVSDRSGWTEVWVCEYPDASNCRQMTAFRQGYVGSPRWSPDSQQIALDARVNGNADIYVVRADGGQPVRLTEGSSVEARPSWSSDGRWIYFRSDRTGAHQIWKIPIAGGAAIQITKNGGFDARESPDGKSLYYVQERYLRGLWSVPVDGGPETRVSGFGSVTASSWSLTDNAIFWIDTTTSNPPAPIRRYDFTSREASTIAEVSGYVIQSATGFYAVRDGTVLMWSQLDRSAHDLMLLERFR